MINKKGSAVVEATMVFPVMIFAVIAVIYILIYFFGQLNSQVKLHSALRAECGSLCDNLFYVNHDGAVPVYRSGKKLYGYRTVSSPENSFIEGRHKEIRAEKYMIDETLFVRLADFGKSGG